jgi:hypothetical protein
MKKLLPGLAFLLLVGLGACKDDDDGATCVYAGETHAVGDEFPARDGCNTCECVAGEGGASLSCTEIDCGGCDGGLGRCSGPQPDATIDADYGGNDGCNGDFRCGGASDADVDASRESP